MLPPWDTIPYFQTPQVRVVSCGIGMTPLASADPMRVMLAVAVNLGGSVQVTPSPAAASNEGIQLNSQTPFILITHETWGAFANLEWFANSVGAQNVTVYSLSLAKWPRGGNGNSARKAASLSRPALGSGRYWFYRDSRP